MSFHFRSEDLEDQIGEAVDDRWLLGKLRG